MESLRSLTTSRWRCEFIHFSYKCYHYAGEENSYGLPYESSITIKVLCRADGSSKVEGGSEYSLRYGS